MPPVPQAQPAAKPDESVDGVKAILLGPPGAGKGTQVRRLSRGLGPLARAGQLGLETGGRVGQKTFHILPSLFFTKF